MLIVVSDPMGNPPTRCAECFPTIETRVLDGAPPHTRICTTFKATKEADCALYEEGPGSRRHARFPSIPLDG